MSGHEWSAGDGFLAGMLLTSLAWAMLLGRSLLRWDRLARRHREAAQRIREEFWVAPAEQEGPRGEGWTSRR